jgi:CelD/BcsL family acetyltransferase involved in cellulose biosynthesis
MLKFISTDEWQSDAFAAQWRALLERCPPHDVGQTETWNRCWWRHYSGTGSPRKELFVLAEEERGQLLSVWPLFVRKRFGLKILSWIGQVDGMITDYTMPLLPESHREKGVQGFLEFLADNASRWDVVDLSIPGWSGLFRVFARSAAVHGSRRELSWSSHIIEHCTVIDLPATFDAFLASLGSTTRSHVRQYLRAAEKVGAEFEIVRGGDCVGGMPELVRLNQERWKVFADVRAREFLTDFVGRLPVGDKSVVLARLHLHGRILAAILGFENQGVCFLHSAGVSRDASAGFSAGTAMYALLIRAMIAEGRTKIDMSPGMEEYKLRLGATVDTIFGLTLWHKSSAIDRWRARQTMIAARRWTSAVTRRIVPARWRQ